MTVGLLSQPTDLDLRVQAGAYISKGIMLYYVAQRSPTQVILENAYSLTLEALSPSEVCKKHAKRAEDYVLVRRARPKEAA